MSRPDLSGVDGAREARRERVATMQRARRLASTAVVAVLAVSGLSACRANPSVAVYGGGDPISEARVDAIYADAQRKLTAANEQVRAQQNPAADPSAAPASPEAKLTIKRRDIVEALLGERVLGAYAAKKNVKPQEIALAQVAQVVGLPENAEYVALYTRYRSLLSALSAAAKPAKATPADLRQIYDRLDAAGSFKEQPVDFAKFAASLGEQDQATLAQTLGLREELKADVGKLHLKVNPRYGIQELSLLPVPSKTQGSTSLVGVPLAANDDAAAVTDVS